MLLLAIGLWIAIIESIVVIGNYDVVFKLFICFIVVSFFWLTRAQTEAKDNKESMVGEFLKTDYLVIGSGLVGMAFVDTLLTETDAHIIIDRKSVV